MLIYVSGKYSGDSYEEIDLNIQKARVASIKLWEAGHAVICPHMNSAHLEVDCSLTWEGYIRADLAMIARCDAIYMLKDWEESKGAVWEKEYAEDMGLWVYYEGDELPKLHPTEIFSPVQTKAFAETLGKMYRVHLQKNADYSPVNILGTGEIGLVTRLWDKMARMMNLSGFRLEGKLKSFQQPKAPQNEALDDTYMDMAVYAVIGLLLRRGQWGR